MGQAFRADSAPTVAMMCVPFFHVGGSLGMLASLYSGNTSVVQERFDAAEWLRLVQEHRVRTAFLVPTMLQRILDHRDFANTDLTSLIAIAYGAAAAPGPIGAPGNGRPATCRVCQRVWPDRNARRLHKLCCRRITAIPTGWAR